MFAPHQGAMGASADESPETRVSSWLLRRESSMESSRGRTALHSVQVQRSTFSSLEIPRHASIAPISLYVPAGLHIVGT